MSGSKLAGLWTPLGRETSEEWMEWMGRCWVTAVAARCQAGASVGRAAATGGELTWTAQSVVMRKAKRRRRRRQRSNHILELSCDWDAQEAEGLS